MTPLLLLALLFVAVAYAVAAWIYCRRLNAETDNMYTDMAEAVLIRLNARYGCRFSIVRRRGKFFLCSNDLPVAFNLSAENLYKTLRKYEMEARRQF